MTNLFFFFLSIRRRPIQVQVLRPKIHPSCSTEGATRRRAKDPGHVFQAQDARREKLRGTQRQRLHGRHTGHGVHVQAPASQVQDKLAVIIILADYYHATSRRKNLSTVGAGRTLGRCCSIVSFHGRAGRELLLQQDFPPLSYVLALDCRHQMPRHRSYRVLGCALLDDQEEPAGGAAFNHEEERARTLCLTQVGSDCRGQPSVQPYRPSPQNTIFTTNAQTV